MPVGHACPNLSCDGLAGLIIDGVPVGCDIRAILILEAIVNLVVVTRTVVVLLHV